jgi:hypothetical protein
MHPSTRHTLSDLWPKKADNKLPGGKTALHEALISAKRKLKLTEIKKNQQKIWD